jgi:hypothetical protein
LQFLAKFCDLSARFPSQGLALAAKPEIMNVPCPFCKPKPEALRGDGCCFCDYIGTIPAKENARLMDPAAENTDKYPFFSDIDLKAGREILKQRNVEGDYH